MSDLKPSKVRPAYAAALWALIFAAFHVFWALGWHVGLDQEQARVAFSKRWFLAYDLIVAATCSFGVLVALALAKPREGRMSPRLLAFSAWAGTALLVLRSGASMIQTVYLLATGRFEMKASCIWESWFYLGAILFGVSTIRYWRLRPVSGAP